MKLRTASKVSLLAAFACATAALPQRARAAQPARPPSKGNAPQRRPRAAERRKQLERLRQAWLDRIRQMNERERTRPKSVHEKNHESIRRAFRPVIAEANRSTVTILCDRAPAALGAVVDAEGLVLTKASELRGTIECKLPSGKKHAAEVIGLSDPHDLALLKIAAKGLRPVAWSEEAVAVGSLVATPNGQPDPVAIGVISVAQRPLKARGFLGIAFGPGGDEPRIGQIIPGTPAAKAGLKVGDVIRQIDGKAVKTPEDVVKAISAHSPGDPVELHLRRGGKDSKHTVTLGSRRLAPSRQSRLDMMNLFGGPLSGRRSDFASALQHDTVLLPSQCGGPLVGLDGKVVGINVARAGRVESYAIPADVVRPLLVELRSGKLAPGPRFALDLKLRAIDKRIADHEQLLRKAQRDKADAERRVKQATAALERAKADRAKLQPDEPKPKPKPDSAPPPKRPAKPKAEAPKK